MPARTFLSYDDAEQRIRRRHRFVEVFIVVDGKEVSLDVCVPQQHVHTGDVVDGLQEVVEVRETSRAIPLEGKAAIFSLKLADKNGTKT